MEGSKWTANENWWRPKRWWEQSAAVMGCSGWEGECPPLLIMIRMQWCRQEVSLSTKQLCGHWLAGCPQHGSRLLTSSEAASQSLSNEALAWCYLRCSCLRCRFPYLLVRIFTWSPPSGRERFCQRSISPGSARRALGWLERGVWVSSSCYLSD